MVSNEMSASSTSFPRALAASIRIRDLLPRVPGKVDLLGDEETVLYAVSPLDRAREGCLCFCRYGGERGVAAVNDCHASAIVIRSDLPLGHSHEKVLLLNPDPRGWFIDAVRFLFPAPSCAGISPSASVANDASVADGVCVGAYAIIEAGAEVGPGCVIGSGCHVSSGVTLGKRVHVKPNTVLGGEGLSFHERPDGSQVSFPHLGRLLVGDDVTIGSHSSIMRGILDDTIIGRGTAIGNHVNIGHNCRVGVGCFLSSGTVLAGGAALGSMARLAASVSVASHIEIGENALVGIGSVIVKNVARNARIFGNPPRSLPTMRRF